MRGKFTTRRLVRFFYSDSVSSSCVHANSPRKRFKSVLSRGQPLSPPRSFIREQSFTRRLSVKSQTQAGGLVEENFANSTLEIVRVDRRDLLESLVRLRAADSEMTLKIERLLRCVIVSLYHGKFRETRRLPRLDSRNPACCYLAFC